MWEATLQVIQNLMTALSSSSIIPIRNRTLHTLLQCFLVVLCTNHYVSPAFANQTPHFLIYWSALVCVSNSWLPSGVVSYSLSGWIPISGRSLMFLCKFCAFVWFGSRRSERNQQLQFHTTDMIRNDLEEKKVQCSHELVNNSWNIYGVAMFSFNWGGSVPGLSECIWF